MSGRDRESDCQVVELQQPACLVIRHQLAGWPTHRYVDGRVHLKAVPKGTKLVQEIDFAKSGILWVFQWFMWLIHATGEPTGKRYLEALKELVESRPDTVHN